MGIIFKNKTAGKAAPVNISKSSSRTADNSPAPEPASYSLADLSTLKNTLSFSEPKERKRAAKAIYELSDVSHKKNRTTIIKTESEIVEALCECLLASSGDARHLALLSLNNLSIPSDNKKTIMNNESSRAIIIDALVTIIQTDPAESYLACIALMNLSFLESAVPIIAANPDLLNTIEGLLKEGVKAKAGSGKSEGVRWSCGLLKNLSRSESAATRIAATDIVGSLVQCLKSPSGAARWSNNSTEDFALFTLLNLSQHQNVLNDLFKKNKVIQTLQPIARSVVGVHSLKATLTIGILKGSTRSEIPPAAGSEVTELVGNILAKKGKEKEYSAGVFKLSTAVLALKGIATKGDASSVATPKAGALMLQIMSSYVLASRESTIADLSPSDNALGVFAAILPSLLQQKSNDSREATPATLKAVAEITSLVQACQDLYSESTSKSLAQDVIDTLKDASAIDRPVLVETKRIWAAQRERDGISDSFFSGEAGQEVDTDGPLSFLPCQLDNGACVIM